MRRIHVIAQPAGDLLLRCFRVYVALWLVAGCGGTLPEDILGRISGTWETDAAGYKGARLEITREKIIFHAVDGTVTSNRIADIRYAVDKTGDLLIIEYRNKYNQKYLLSFYLLATPDGDTLVKKNQQHIIWKKSPVGP